MSKYFNAALNGLAPYTPGEQPKVTNLIKLNTNESPFPPSEKAVLFASEAARKLELYPDPTCGALHAAFAGRCGSLCCRELLSYDFAVEGEREKARASGVLLERCPAFARAAMEEVQKLLEE